MDTSTQKVSLRNILRKLISGGGYPVKKWKTVIITSVLTLVISLIVGFTQFDTFQSTTLDDTDTNSSEIVEETYTVTLITGDRVNVTQFEDGHLALDIEPAEREGYEPRFEKMEIDNEQVYVIPNDVAKYIPDKLDRDLFNITKLIEYAYDDAETDNIPIIISLEDNISMHNENSLNTLFSDAKVLSSINAFAADISKKETTPSNTSLFRQQSLQSTNIFKNVKKIHLDRKVEVELEDSVPQIGAPKAWDAGYDGTGLTVAVLDSGIDTDHPDLEGKVVAEQNFTSDDTTKDLHGHGTHVAATIAGSGDASDGMRQGVAPGASLINAKVLNARGSGATSDIIAGMEWAAQEGASILNMSLGGGVTDGTDPLSLAVNSISEEYNVLFVVSAGNSGPGDESITTPGAADYALTVGAFDKDGELAGFSSRGPRIGDYAITPHITAPGVNIQAARADGTSMGTPIDDYYTSANGTSMAAPHVAGAAALYAQKIQDEGKFQADLIKSALISTSVPSEDYSVYEQGGGLVDVERALTQNVFAETAPINFGTFEYPQDDLDPVTETVTYRNMSEEEVTLDLSIDIDAPEEHSLPESMIELSEYEVVIEAGGTADIEITVDLTLGELGLYGGYITAKSAYEDILVKSPVGFHKEPEIYNLTVKATLGDQPMLNSSKLSNINLEDMSIFNELNVRFNNEEETDVGEISYRVPAGTYNVNGILEGTGVDVMINVPDVKVAKDKTVMLDARDRAYDQKITHTLEDKAEERATRYSYYRSSENGGAIVSEYVRSNRDKDAELYVHAPMEEDMKGEFEFYTDWEYNSSEETTDPVHYKLILPEESVTSAIHYEIDPETLKQENAKYYVHQPGEHYEIFHHKWRPYMSASFGFGREIDVPLERTEYYIANDTRYRKNVKIGTARRSQAMYNHSATSQYEVGEFDVNWFKQPIRSGLFKGDPPENHTPLYREENVLEVPLYEYLDAQGNRNNTNYGSIIDNIDTTFRIYEDDYLIGESNLPRGSFPLSSEESQVKIELDVKDLGTWGGFSPTVLTNWTFSAMEPSAGEQEIVPLIDIDYNLNLNMDNTALRDGENNILFEVNHQPGADSYAIEDLKVWISYNDGQNWQGLYDVKQINNGEYKAELNHESSTGGSGFVSLKVEARDTDGNSIEQEFIRAYRVPVTAESMETHVKRLVDEGEFENEASARLLKTHLTAVSLFENQGEADKVVRHMKSFDMLLDHQLDQGEISEEAHAFLKNDSNTITEYWK